MTDFAKQADIYLKDNPTATFADLAASAVGFSRGAVTAIVFTQLLNERGLVLPDGTVVAPPGVRVTGLVPIDPVATFIEGSFTIPPNVEGPILVPRASEDMRVAFNALNLSNDSRVETFEIKANHSGAGGVDDKNGTGAAVLEGATRDTNGSNAMSGSDINSWQVPPIDDNCYIFNSYLGNKYAGFSLNTPKNTFPCRHMR